MESSNPMKTPNPTAIPSPTKARTLARVLREPDGVIRIETDRYRVRLDST